VSQEEEFCSRFSLADTPLTYDPSVDNQLVSLLPVDSARSLPWPESQGLARTSHHPPEYASNHEEDPADDDGADDVINGG
jgi:hypothetical protein